MIPCEDCGTPWESTAAANECAILDAAETRACVNPDHLEPVTKYENIRRMHVLRGRAALCCDIISNDLDDTRPPRYYLSED